MLPTHEGLHRGRDARSKVDDRLVVEPQLVPDDGIAQISLELDARVGDLSFNRVVHAKLPLA